MPVGAVDRIRITTVVDNYIDNLRRDDAVARRYSAFVAGKMPDLRAEHGLAHLVETTRGAERFTLALDFGLTADTVNANFRELALDPASIDALALSHGHRDHWGGLTGFLHAWRRRLRRDLPFYGGVDHFRARWQQREERRVYSGRLSRDEIERYEIDVRLAAKPTPIAEGLWLSGEMHAIEDWETIPAISGSRRTASWSRTRSSASRRWSPTSATAGWWWSRRARTAASSASAATPRASPACHGCMPSSEGST